jgi:tRNA threonylcarbamoyl adenosine modification protein (Sua5/YciO/YrdC/YwlC family)
MYGIGCNALSKDGVRRLQRFVRDVKGDAEHSPLSLICRDLSQVSVFGHMGDEAFRIMRQILPGPYTLLLKPTREAPRFSSKKRRKIGVRVPSVAIPVEIVRHMDAPLLTTSARFADVGAICDPWTLDDLFSHVVDAVVDGGFIDPQPSTILDLSDGGVSVVREGKGPIAHLF